MGEKLPHRVAAIVSSPAIAAKVAAPNGIELLDKRLDKCWVVSQNTVLKIALFLGLRSHSSAGEIRRTEIRLYAVNNDALEMNSRAEHPFHRRSKHRIAVEVIPPVRSGILRMDEPHLDPALHHPVQHFQERHHLASTRVNIHVLDVVTAERSEGRA